MHEYLTAFGWPNWGLLVLQIGALTLQIHALVKGRRLARAAEVSFGDLIRRLAAACAEVGRDRARVGVLVEMMEARLAEDDDRPTVN